MTTFVAILIVVAAVAGVFLWQKVTSSVVGATARAANRKLLYKSEAEEGDEIVTAPLVIEVHASLLDVIHALNAHVELAEHLPAAFKAVVYKSSGSAQRITYAYGNKAVPKTFEAEVSFAAHGDATTVAFRVLSWQQQDGLVVGLEVLSRLRRQVQSALATLDATASSSEAAPAPSGAPVLTGASRPAEAVRAPRPRGGSRSRQKKTALKIVGIILWLIGATWAGVIGFYVRDLPVLFAILVAGAVCLYISSKIRVDEEGAGQGHSARGSSSSAAPEQLRRPLVTSDAPSADSASLAGPAEAADGVAAASCASCGASLSQGAAFCSACGGAVATAKVRRASPAARPDAASAAKRSSRVATGASRRRMIYAVVAAVGVVGVVLAITLWPGSGAPAASDVPSLGVSSQVAPAPAEPTDAGGSVDPALVAAGWIARPSGTTASLISTASVDQCAWAVGDEGVIVASSDRGWTWAPRDSGTRRTLFGVAFSDASRGWAVGQKGTIVATNDGGESWRKRVAETSEPLYGVACSVSGRMFAVGRAGSIVASDDAGETWQAVASGTHEWLSGVAFLGSGEALAVGDHGTILRSGGQANAWTARDSGVSAWLCSVSCPDESHAWAVGSGGVIVASQDGGDTWMAQHSGTTNDLYGVAFADSLHGWAVGKSGTLLQTVDGGASWEQRDVPSGENLWGVGFANVSGGCAVGDGGTVLTGFVGE